MKNKNVLISGASVAGPALAYWLGRFGFSPTVVEVAPVLRGGGYAVDFRGPAHLTVLERMGVLDELRRLQTGGSPMRFVDEQGRQLLHLPGKLAGIGGDHRDGAKASTFFAFASKRLDYDRSDLDQQKKLLADAYVEVGWAVPTLVEALWDARELYFDSISRVDVTTARRSRGTRARCGTTSAAVRRAATGPGSSWRRAAGPPSACATGC